jgi:hypothetical protein
MRRRIWSFGWISFIKVCRGWIHANVYSIKEGLLLMELEFIGMGRLLFWKESTRRSILKLEDCSIIFSKWNEFIDDLYDCRCFSYAKL